MKKHQLDIGRYKDQLIELLETINSKKTLNQRQLSVIMRQFPKDGNQLFGKDDLVAAYKALSKKGLVKISKTMLDKIKMKPTRTISGVVPVTVLTRPFPCPGRCIFCPNDIRMPKSYLSDEPGAQRAERNHFDPYLQTYNRLNALESIGHEVAKVELIILGGTWSYYPEKYQVWYIKRCFEAMNDFGNKDQRQEIHTQNIYFAAEKTKRVIDQTGRRKTYNQQVIEKEREAGGKIGLGNINIEHDYSGTVNKETATWEDLFEQQKINENSNVRCVGLVIETRPDHISEEEVLRIRKLGATKTQIGFQSLNDEVLDKNKRGHDVAATIRAIKLLRAAGFKIHGHWMANLYGSDPEMDKKDYEKLFTPDFQPDELKIYPCSLIETAELYDYYEKGLWKPFTEQELLGVVTHAITHTPRYTRLTRIIRDIPSQDIVVGNKKTNFRQIVENHIAENKLPVEEIRYREIRNRTVKPDDLQLKITEYKAKNIYGNARELFLEYVTEDNKICGFLRLDLPKKVKNHFIPELAEAAIIREVHVYGVVQNFGDQGNSQHLGLGTKLILKAKEIAKKEGYTKLSVISAIGTKEYYRSRGFADGPWYQHMDL